MERESESLEDQMRLVRRRLQQITREREQYDGGHPTARYCLICDEHVLVTRDESGEYTRLQCRHEHFDSIIEVAHDNAELSAWVDCIDYFIGSENNHRAEE